METAVLLTLTAIVGAPTGTDTPEDTPEPATATATRTLVPPNPSATRRPSATIPPPTTGGVVLPAASATSTTGPTAVPPSDTPPSVPSDTATATDSPTETPTSPPPTSTSPPPPTSTPDVCASTGLSAAGVQWHEARWNLTNQGQSTITITGLWIDWPGSNDDLTLVELRNASIWDGWDSSPPTNISGGWKPGSRNIGPGESARLDFRFSQDAAGSGYSLSVTLNGACSVGSGQ
jgi:hypothetical protein